MQKLSALVFAFCCLSSSSAHADVIGWDPSVGDPGIDGNVFALGSFDGGLYAGGDFANAGGSPASRIAVWQFGVWSEVGGGVSNGAVRCFAVFDDGNGPALFVGGQFNIAGGVSVSRIARWDGSAWSDVGGGVSGAIVSAMAVFDDGGGPDLYVAGSFSSAGGVPASNISRWDGAAWSAVGTGVNSSTNALLVHDDGSGSDLYAGGFFSSAGGQPASFIASWDGAGWSALGSGVDNAVWALESFDAGSGAELYAGGDFLNAGGSAASRIARWNGTDWSAVGSGMNGVVWTLEVFASTGSIDELYAGGGFTSAGGNDADRFALLAGTEWFGFGEFDADVRALLAFDDDEMYAGGLFTSVDGNTANHVARFIGCDDAFFKRADVDANGTLNGLVDSLFLLAFAFQGGPEPPCMAAADVDGNEVVNGLTDTIYLLAYAFQGGPEPPFPFPDCSFVAGPIDCNAPACP